MAQVFCCIENVTIYFEAISPIRPRRVLRSQLHRDDSSLQAYRHVLIALQNMRATDVMTSYVDISRLRASFLNLLFLQVPFQHTLLSQQPDPLPPTYLKDIGFQFELVDSRQSSSEQEETDMFHFHNVFSSCEKASLSKNCFSGMSDLAKVDCEVSAPKSFRILAEWPPALRQLEAQEHLSSQASGPKQSHKSVEGSGSGPIAAGRRAACALPIAHEVKRSSGPGVAAADNGSPLAQALTNQMALIQGPPGTGKPRP